MKTEISKKRIQLNHAARSVLLNLVFLLIFLLIFHPYYEVRDDNMMKEIAAGGRGTYNSYLVFINIIIGKVISTLYTLVPSLEWYSIVQTVFVFLSFLFLIWMIYDKWGAAWGTGLSILILGFFGYECYVLMQFTKTAGLTTLTGGLLIYYVFANKKKKWLLLPGMIFMVVGSMYRYNMYGMILIGIMPLYAYTLLRGGREKIRENLRPVLSSAVVYAVVVVLALGAKNVNNYIYNQDPQWQYFWRYNAARASLMDHGLLDYNEYKDFYQSLKITEEDYKYYKEGYTADPDKFSLEIMEKLVTKKAEKKGDFGEFLIGFFSKFPLAFLKIGGFGAFLLLAAFAVMRDHRSIFLIMMQSVIILSLYGYLYYHGRFLINRVDAPFFLAQTAIAVLGCDSLQNREGWNFRTLPILLGSVILILSCRGNIFYKNVTRETETYISDKKEWQEVLQLMGEDKEHLYLTHQEETEKAWGIYDAIPFGGLSNIYRIHGWQLALPENQGVLGAYCIANPYNDSVDNERVYWPVKKRPTNMIKYIRRNYNKSAELIKIKEINGMKFYIVRSGEFMLNANDIKRADDTVFSNAEASYEGTKLYLNGKVYKKGTDGFQQRVYLKVEKGTGNIAYRDVTLVKGEEKSKTKEGIYATIDASYSFKVWKEEWKVSLILESEGVKYEIPLNVDIR